MLSTITKTNNTVNTKISPAYFRSANQNSLLAALPVEDYERLLPSLKFVRLSLDEILCDSDDEMAYLYFPTNSIVSLIYTSENGSTAEMGMVGRCGVIGISNFLGGKSTPNQGIVQVAGGAFKIKAQTVCEEFSRGGALHDVLLCFTQLLLTQISQIAACNRLHCFEQRFCRWLLFSHDRVLKDEILLTQEIIAHLLGVRREGVTVVAGRLQDEGLISYVRGHITILDRRGLEKRTCECYKVITDEYQRLIAF